MGQARRRGVVDSQGRIRLRRGSTRSREARVRRGARDGGSRRAGKDLGEIKQKSGKIVSAWAVAGDLDVTEITSNTVEVQWPPRSGKMLEIPEVDRAEWFAIHEAREKINPAQAELLDRLAEILDIA